MSIAKFSGLANLKVPETRRRALTSLPLPKLTEESSSLAMDIESDHSEANFTSTTRFQQDSLSSKSTSLKKECLNSTLHSLIPSLSISTSPAIRILRLNSQGRIYFNTVHLKLQNASVFDFFAKHEITEKFRAKMLDWMVEVLRIYQQSDETLFKAFSLLDTFLLQTTRHVLARDLHLLGAACMFLASKQEEVHPVKLETLIVDICKNKFSKEDILSQELEVLITINFRTHLPNVFSFSHCLLGILGLHDEIIFKFVENVVVLILKMSLFFRDLVSRFTCFEISAAALIMSLKLAESVQFKFNAALFVF